MNKRSTCGPLFIVAVLLFLASCSDRKSGNGFDQNYYLSFPSYGQVVQEFFRHYKDIFQTKVDSVNQTATRTTWVVLKKPEGWFMAEGLIQDTLALKKVYKFWSADEKKFLPLDVEKGLNPDSNQIYGRFFYGTQLHDFNVHPFFGYEDWAKDVIRIFGPQKDLNDTLMYGLGRAYGASAFARIGIRTDPFLRINMAFAKTFDEKDASQDAEINKSLEEARLSIERLEQLQKQAPGFKPKFGTLAFKIANDRMMYWLHFTMLGKKDEAAKFLKQDSYSPMERNFAVNMLNTCADSSVLITWEDLDTWPLLFARQVLGIRKDVTVIPQNLLTVPVFIHKLKHDLHLGYPETFYNEIAAYGFGLEGPKGKIVQATVKDIEDLFLNTNNSRTDRNWSIAANEIKLPVNAADASKTFGSGLRAELVWSGLDQLMVTDLLLFDLIRNAKPEWSRPVEFSSCGNNLVYFPVPQYLWTKGLTAQLRPTKAGVNNRFNLSTGNVDVQALEKNIFTGYDFSGLGGNDDNSNFILYTYKQCFSAGASGSAAQGGKTAAMKWVNECLRLFPADKYPLHGDDYWMAVAASEAGEKEIGSSLIRKIKDGVFEQIKKGNVGAEEFKNLRGLLSYLSKLAANLGDTSLESELRLAVDALPGE